MSSQSSYSSQPQQWRNSPSLLHLLQWLQIPDQEPHLCNSFAKLHPSHGHYIHLFRKYRFRFRFKIILRDGKPKCSADALLVVQFCLRIRGRVNGPGDQLIKLCLVREDRSPGSVVLLALVKTFDPIGCNSFKQDTSLIRSKNLMSQQNLHCFSLA